MRQVVPVLALLCSAGSLPAGAVGLPAPVKAAVKAPAQKPPVAAKSAAKSAASVAPKAAPTSAATAASPVVAVAPHDFVPARLFPDALVSERTLANGVRGVVRTTRNSDLVCVQVWVRAGSRFEAPSESGMAHLVESASFRGTRSWPAGETDSGGPTGALGALGGVSASLTSRDATFYSATVASPYFPSALRVLADVILHPDLSSNGVEAGKLQLENDALRTLLDPVATATNLAYATAFSKSPYRRPAEGEPTNIDNLTAARAQIYHQKWYVGKNITVVVVGDVGADMAHTLIGRYFGSASKFSPPPLKYGPEAPLHKVTVAHRTRAPGSAIVLAWRSAPITSPNDVAAMDTLLAMWREGLDANLRKLLMRDGDKGPNMPLVSSYDVDYLTQKDQGLFDISLTGATDSDAAVAVVLAEVRRVRDHGVSQQERNRAATALRRQYAVQSATGSGQAGALGFYDMIDSYRFGQYYLDRTERVTAADIQRVARKYLSPETYIRAEISPIPAAHQDTGGGPSITAKLPQLGHLTAWHGSSVSNGDSQ